MNTNVKIIGETVQKLRRAQNETQEQLANAVGVTAQAVSKWENGGVPDIELLPAIAEHYGVTVDALFGNDLSETVGLEDAFLKTLADTPYDKWIDRVYDLLWKIERTAFDGKVADYESIDKLIKLAEEDGALDNQHYSSASRPGGFTHMSLNKAKYFLLVKDPENWDEALFGPELGYNIDKFDYPALFKDLSDPDFFNVLLGMHRRDTAKPFTPSLLVKNFGVTSEKASEIISLFEKYRFVSALTIDIDDETVKVYRFEQSCSFVAFMIFARQLIAKPGVWSYYIGGGSAPKIK